MENGELQCTHNLINSIWVLPAADLMTNDELQQAVAANTAAINALVTQFIQPNAQQALENQRSVGQVIELMDRHARAIVEIDERLEANTQQVAANTQQIAAIGDRLEQFDQRLEETRTLVAENGSRIAQLSVKQDQLLDRIDNQISTLRESQQAQLDRVDSQISALIEENRAFRESQQAQLAAIIGNGRRIDRLEQQAS